MDHVTIAHLRVFRDIAQTHSISEAAELNQISQSAASQSLKSLERYCGFDFVDRSRRPLSLTAPGRLCLDACREIVRRFDELEDRLGELRGDSSGDVRVVSIYSIGLSEMTRFKEEFERERPGATIHLDYMRPDKIYQAMEEGRADMGLVSYPQPTRQLRVIDWRMEKMALVCHPNHPLAGKSKILPQDLARTDFISFDRGLQIRRAIDRFLREHQVQREVALEFDNIQMIKEALSINQGVSILPERTVRQEVAEGRLRLIPIEAEGLIRPVGILLDRKKALDRTGAEFLEYLQRNAEKNGSL